MLLLHGKGKGDLFVVVEVRTPTALSPQQKELLREFARLDREHEDPVYQTGND